MGDAESLGQASLEGGLLGACDDRGRQDGQDQETYEAAARHGDSILRGRSRGVEKMGLPKAEDSPRGPCGSRA